MAGGSLIALLDDISSVLDDVAAMTKMAAKKTSGVVGDDLALNAEKVAGLNADRELPVVWSVAKGSLVNKIILVPSALAISAVAPGAILPLLMAGGLYLCYEGSEKIIEKIMHKKDTSPHGIEDDVKEMLEHHKEKKLSKVEEAKTEKEKIKGAIKTDFVLSAEIIVIALGVVAAMPLLSQAVVLGSIGVAMTVGVYGVVAVIVKADDIGLFMMNLKKENFINKMDGLNDKAKKHSSLIKPITIPLNKLISVAGKTFFNNSASIKTLNFFGEKTINFMPKFMKALTFVGTVAMFSVGGSIIAHGLPFLHGIEEALQHDGILGTLAGFGFDIGVGLASGISAVGVMHVIDPLGKYMKPLANFVKKFSSDESLVSDNQEKKN
jgi:uncharacterized protein